MSIYAGSDNNVYAIGNGNEQDQGGPLVLLHYNGRTWSKVAGGNYGSNLESSGQIASDGHGGLWISASGYQGLPSYILHYSAGKLTPATLPVGAQSITVESVVSIPGTGQALAGGFTHAPNAPATNVAAVILQYS